MGAPAPRGRAEILPAIEAELRARGYDGASIADLSQATGLGKSSLYHHFPGGKPEMVDACAKAVAQRMTARLARLDDLPTPRARLEALFEAFDAYFESGRRMCLMTMVANSSAADALRPVMQASIDRAVAAIARILGAAGQDPADARARAEEAFAMVQGAVVMAQATGDTALFRRLVARLPDRLLA